MQTYTIEIKYIASIQEVVQANDEGEALDKARNKAEEASKDEFNMGEELESRIVNTY